MWSQQTRDRLAKVRQEDLVDRVTRLREGRTRAAAARVQHPRRRLMAVTASALLPVGTAAATSQAPSTTLVVNARIAGPYSFDRVVIDAKGKLPPTTVTRVKELRPERFVLGIAHHNTCRTSH